MTPSKMNHTIHPVLIELGLPLPMQPDTSWSLSRLDDGSAMPSQCRISLTDAGDLVIEVADTAQASARYVFDAAGHLVSLHHSKHFEGPLFEELRRKALHTIRSQWEREHIGNSSDASAIIVL